MAEESIKELKEMLAAEKSKNAALDEERCRIHKEKVDKTFKLYEIMKKLEKITSERDKNATALRNILEKAQNVKSGSHEETLKKIAEEEKKHFKDED